MPAVHYRLRWPDASVIECYSPSTVIRDYLRPHTRYALDDFMALARAAYPRASDRVRERFGYECSSAADQLAELEQRAARYAGCPDATVDVLDLE